MASTITAGNATNGLGVTSDNTGILELKTGTGAGTTAINIDASQNVGIGTTAPTTILNVYNPTSAAISVDGDAVTSIRASRYSNDTGAGNVALRKARGTLASPSAVNSGDNAGIVAFQSYGGSNYRTVAQILGSCDIYTADDDISGILTFLTRPTGAGAVTTERMRITSAGELWVARTTDAGAFNIQCGGTGVWGAGAYTNGSDARIKEDITPITSGLDVVTKLNPVTYRYKASWSKDQSIQPGFIAQEMLVAMEGKDYVDGVVVQGGSEGYYSVAYQNIIPLLTKAIQELNAKVEAQAAEIAALKGAA
jgi:hypothetical protein